MAEVSRGPVDVIEEVKELVAGHSRWRGNWKSNWTVRTGGSAKQSQGAPCTGTNPETADTAKGSPPPLPHPCKTRLKAGRDNS